MSMQDPDYRKRATIALALAIAIHEVGAGFVGAPFQESRPADVRVYAITITHATPTPKPTPKPTPIPSARPTPVVTPHPRATIALVTATHKESKRAAAVVAKKIGGAAGVKHIAAKQATHRTAIIAGHASGVAGSGKGTGAGPATGTGGLGGSGKGVGNSGEFDGLPPADVPCGEPNLGARVSKYIGGGKFDVDVYVEITFRDGHVESGNLPYRFRYNSEAENPFSEQHKHDGYPTYLQTPPPGTDLSSMPRAVTFALKYTDAEGRTHLPECPKPPRG